MLAHTPMQQAETKLASPHRTGQPPRLSAALWRSESMLARSDTPPHLWGPAGTREEMWRVALTKFALGHYPNLSLRKYQRS